jgi:hypothetical protein
MNLSHEDHYKGFVLGFLFSKDLKNVLLKANSLDGIGGKINPGESHQAAMWRNFRETTGVAIYNWKYLKPVEISQKIYVHIFYNIGDIDIYESKDFCVASIEVLNYMAYALNSVPLILECRDLVKYTSDQS